MNTHSCRILFVILMLMSAGVSAQSNEFAGFVDPFPLRPADTSSPRDTLRSFIVNAREAVAAAESGDPVTVRRLISRAAMTMDLSELPAHTLRTDAIVKMVLLNEILDRVQLPAYDRIPGRQEVKQQGVTQWIVPNTEIKITRIEDGSRKGEFLFTKETVAGLKQYYEIAKNLPYLQGAAVGLYDKLLIAPGWLLPGDFPDLLPGWAKNIVAGQAIWQWLGLAVILVIAVFIVGWLYRWGHRWDDRYLEERSWLRFGVPVALLGVIAITLLVRVAVIDVFWLFGTPYQVMSIILLTVVFVTAAWIVVAMAGRLGNVIGQLKEGKDSRYDQALMRMIFRLVGIVIVVYIGVYAADYFGIPIAPLVAGLGVGGLAIALAVRPTLENIIGGLTMFADRPLRVGDFCRYGDQIGEVEAIGLRSTRIRSLDRTIITVPNAEFSQMKLENFMVRDRRLLRTTLQLRYETTPDQMRHVLARLREMLLGHPKVISDSARVRLIGYSAYSKDVEIFAYIACRDSNTFLAIQEDILLRIEDIILASGTGFAFPSQTTYFAPDTGLDSERKAEVESEVGSWRARGKLPFPEFEEEDSELLEDTLDYPPKGSPDYKPRTG